MKPLTLYVDPAWRRAGWQHTPLLIPFWGNPLGDSQPFWKELFDRHSYDTNLYTVTDDPAKADMVLVPYSHNYLLSLEPGLIEACSRTAERLGKPLLIDGLGDVERPITTPNTFVLRYGGYRFAPEANAIYVPLYADDLLEAYCGGQLQLRRKVAVPVVGFAGWARMSTRQSVRTIIKELPVRLRALYDRRYNTMRKGVFWRQEAVAVLQNSDKVKTNFILRPSFSANARTMAGKPEDLRREFVENLLTSDYGLCVRGDANASVRLFETLALGRIPVILDTECVLPFANTVDYRQFALIVDYTELSRLSERIAEFHAGLTGEQFEAMQRRAREAYLLHFRIEALMPHIVRILQKLGANDR